uniref:Zinc finger protein n=1 Tax=Ciona intestinalis TaxID=7719 RepID=Q1RPY6_CIOIN|nr:zinc finger protein [Ciona intestinalis]BAE93299.1 zinc finger protein [Ciona intestinalis]|eukprot:NP_001071912.1 zinc finger protein [Ciona intestinalis]
MMNPNMHQCGTNMTYPSLFDYPMSNIAPPPAPPPFMNCPPINGANAYSYQCWNNQQFDQQGQQNYFQANMMSTFSQSPAPQQNQPWKQKQNFGNSNNFNRKRKIKDPVFVDFCDVCDRGFKNEEKKLEHYSQHVKCKEPGCKFEAHFKLVEIHRRNLHGPNGRRIKLETPEDVQKWREERRKNFPTSSRMQTKALEEKTLAESGAVLQPTSFGKFKSRNNRNRRKGKESPEANAPLPKKIPAEGSDNTTSQVVKNETDPMNMLLESNGDKEKDSLKEDQEEDAKLQPTSMITEEGGGALNQLMMDYGSDSDTDAGPASVDISSQQDTAAKPEIPKPQVNPPSPVRTPNQNVTKKQNRYNQKKRPFPSKTRYKSRLSRPSLLRMLLEPEIRTERNEILQCVRYIVKNNFFDEQTNAN